MREILIFAGTTEGRKLSECLAVSGIHHTACVATQYGEIVLQESPFLTIHRGRMDCGQIREWIRNGTYAAVVDATHPYAEVITENIKQAMQGMKIPYFRLKRELGPDMEESTVRHFDTNEACALALSGSEGNILLTTGSKELSCYCAHEDLKNRLYVRVLPGMESLSACVDCGIMGKQIIAMQGPFTVEMNEAMIHQYKISCLVTKQSGASGGYPEKLMAAYRAGIPVYVIGHPREEEGYSFREVCRKLEELTEQKIHITDALIQIILAGVGMGHRNGLTKEVADAIDRADILLGAERLLAPYHPRLEKKAMYQAEQILPYLEDLQEKGMLPEEGRVVVLFSGDSGFYSGCQSLYRALQQEVDAGRLSAGLQILPGISSVAYLAACTGESYQDADVCSMHGKKLYNLANRIKNHRKTFLLTSGVDDINRLGRCLLEAELKSCEIITGYQLSDTQQQIRKLSPEECCDLKEEGLYTCLIKNPGAQSKKLTPGMADEEFIRDKVPMTKEEVREVSICKLQLHEGAVVYDIGSGTGSVAVEIAALSDRIRVYAVEQKKEAVSLIEQNRKKQQLENITVIEAKAPEGLEKLPAATHAFIGGSGGNLKEILKALYRINPGMRVVINAISMETLCEIREILSSFPIEKEELVQIQTDRVKKAGDYHLMQAENPIWIAAFRFMEPETSEDGTADAIVHIEKPQI